MARLQLALRTSGTASGAAAAEIRSTSTNRPRILAIKVTLATAVASLIGIGRPAAIGITPTSPVAFLPLEPGDPAGVTTMALAWATGPTAPTNFLDRVGIPGAIGNSYVFDYGPNGLIIPVSSSLVIWNNQLNGLFDVTAIIDE